MDADTSQTILLRATQVNLLTATRSCVLCVPVIRELSTCRAIIALCKQVRYADPGQLNDLRIGAMHSHCIQSLYKHYTAYTQSICMCSLMCYVSLSTCQHTAHINSIRYNLSHAFHGTDDYSTIRMAMMFEG